jgi:radical SAM protein with 4Fe4S-binding SPASM domain
VRVRYEDFGAIVEIEDPPALLWVDRALAREIGGVEAERWARPRGHLSAPTEVHLMTTNRCHAGCPGCYAGSVPDADDVSTEALRGVLEELAAFGVFHVAMGGGESMLRADLFELASYARSVGLVPNLTTSGVGMTAERAARCGVFGQVNVSLDGVGETYRASRGYDGAEVALRALRMLVEAQVPCGINYVLSRPTWDGLEETAAHVAALGANEIEVLRFKPAGRGRAVYEDFRLTPEQGASLFERLERLGRRHRGLAIKVDCSLVPLVCAANPPLERLEQFAVFGCEAGNALAAVRANLDATPCSFIEARVGGVRDLVDGWEQSPELGRWRSHFEGPGEPCASCPYRTVCKGGCRVVSGHVAGDPFAPDPECPRVIAYRTT